MNFIGIPKLLQKGGIKVGFKFKENVGYSQIHQRIKHKLIKPCLCFCGKRPPIDLHNIDGKYTEDINTWEWLCRSCHCKKHRFSKLQIKK